MSKVAIVSTVKTSQYELASFVHYHLNIGIDQIILFFDDPLDASLPLMQTYTQLVCIVCDEDYWAKIGLTGDLSLAQRQIPNANHGLHIARKHGYDWLVHIDSDEFLYAKDTIGTLLDSAGASVVRFTLLEFSPQVLYNDRPFTDLALFKRMPAYWQKSLCRLLGCKNAFFGNEYFRGHVGSKVAFRTNLEIEKVGVHKVFLQTTEKEVISRAIELLHFDSYTFENWKQKWTMRLVKKELQEKGRRKTRTKQFELFQKYRDNEDGLKKTYQRLYIFSPYEKWMLESFSLLETVKLDKSLFQKHSSVDLKDNKTTLR